MADRSIEDRVASSRRSISRSDTPFHSSSRRPPRLCGEICFVFLSLLVLPHAARADEPNLARGGNWTLASYGAYSHSFTGPRASIGSGTVGIGRYLWNDFSLNAELGYYRNDQKGPDADIAAADLLIRHHILDRGRFSLFLDAGASVSYADRRTPSSGTYFNFMEEAGIGSTFQLQDNLHLLSGVRFFHLSNARLDGPNRNPSINAYQFYLGVMIKL